MTVTQVQLKPCPFCGGDGCVSDTYAWCDYHAWSVSCEKCECGTGQRDTESEAITTWSTRASEDAERPLLEHIGKLEAALSLAANRLHRRSLDFDAGTALFIETCEWADEARQALGETQ